MRTSATTSGSARLAAGRLGAILALASILWSACGPATGPGTASSVPPPRATGQKTIRIATLREPVKGLAPPGGAQFGDMDSVALIFHDGLTIYDNQGVLQPRIAEKIPTIEDGDWILNPDGTMDVTWRLRPDVLWQDGVHLTADDFAFGVRLVQDPEVPLFRSTGLKLLSGASVTDPQTIVLHWKQPWFLANVATSLDTPAVPYRILGDMYERRDLQGLINSQYWTSEFVGLGPYRITQWVPGSHAEGEAFDGYFLGRPKIDRVVLRYFTDLETMVTNLLSGDVDMIPAGTIKTEEVNTIRGAWEPHNGGNVLLSKVEVQNLRIQFRYADAPWATDAHVRRALVTMLDRQSIVDALLYGSTTVADVLAQPSDPVFSLLRQRGYATYPYDVAAGERLLADAGWARAPEGGFVRPTGERFGMEFRVVANSQYNVREGLAITDQWKSVGLNPSLTIIAPLDPTKEEQKATAQGVYWFPDKLDPRVMENFTTAQTSSETNRWRGNNYGAYSNRAYDDLYDRYATSLEPDERLSHFADLLRLAADDVPIIPIYYTNNYASAVRTGIHGPQTVTAVQLASTPNMYEWDMDP